ncbi:MAG: autotransporter-associated beta strand repeat-containing protein [Phyllobacterium sp.]
MTKWKGEVASYAPNIAEIAARLAGGAAALSLASMLTVSAAAAADRYWDPNGTAVGRGGAGTWNLSSPLWSPSGDGVSGPYAAWSNSAIDTAIFGGTAAGTITLGSPISVGGMTFETGGYTLNGGTLTLGGVTPVITTNGSATINSVITGSAGLTKAGGGALTLNGINTFTGGIYLNAGSLYAGGDSALGAAGNNIFTAAGVSVGLAIGGTGTSRTITIGDGGWLSLSGTGASSALITGNGGVNLAADMTLGNDASTYTGSTRFYGKNGIANSYFTSIGNLGEASSLGAPTTVSDGTIVFNQTSQYSDNVIYIGDGDSSNRNWQLSGAAALIRNRGTGALTITGDISTSGGSGFYAEGADIGLLGILSGDNYSFNGDASRMIALGGANSYTGVTSINTVTVSASVLADGGTASSFGAGAGAGAGAISIGGDGAVSYTGAGASSNRQWAIGAGSILNDGSGALALSGTVDLGTAANDSFTLGGSFTGENTLSGVISGEGDLKSDGAGTWVLDAANTRTGAIIVEGGTLKAGRASAFGVTTGVTVNGGTLDLGGFDTAFTSLAGSGGSIELGGAELAVKGATSSTFGGSIIGNGDLLKQGTSTLTLTGTSTFTGNTTINGGAITLDFADAAAPANDILSATSTLNLAGGALNVVGADAETNSQTVNGLNIIAGSNKISALSGVGGSLALNLGGITRTGGIVDFSMNAGTTITTSSTALGGWATVNGTDYAKVDAGRIVALDASDYANKDDAATWLDGDIVSDAGGPANTPYFGTVTGSQHLGGLKYTAAAGATVAVAAGETLGIDGTIIVADTVGTANQRITGGQITGGAGGGVLGLQHNGGGNFTIESAIVDNSGATGFTKAGSGYATLSGASTYTGVTTLSGGTLAINSVANAGTASAIGAATTDASNLVLESGVLTYVGATASTDRGFTLVNGGPSRTIEVALAGTNVTFSGLVTSADDAGFIKTGPGTLTLANDSNDYIGVTTVNGGTLAVNTLADGGQVSGIGKSSSDAANLVLGAGGRLRYTGGTASIDRGFTVNYASGRIDVSSAATTLTISGTATGTGALQKEGAGTLVLSGANTYTGNTLVSGGTLRAGSSQAFGSNTSMMTVDALGTLDLGGFDITVGGLLGAGLVDLGGNTLTSSGLSANGFTGRITGTGGFTRTGTWTQTLSGCNNDYTGKTTVSGGGTLSVDCLADGGVASGIGASSADSANLVLTGGVLNYTGNTVTTNRGFTLQGGTGAIGVNNAATTLTFTGQVVGGGSLRKDGLGTLILTADNTYTGATRVTGGILRAGSSSAFGGGDMTLDNTASVALDLNGFDTSVSNLFNGGTTGGNIELGGATLTISAGNFSNTSYYAGAISGIGSLVKNGGGIQRLTGCASSYSGSTTINGGYLEVACLGDGGIASSIGMSSADASNLVINGGAFRYIGSGGSTNRQFTLGASGGNSLESWGTGAINFTSNAAVTFAAANTAQTLTLAGTNTGDNKLGAQLINNGTGETSLTKSGTGTWILTNENSTYTGVTRINGGVLGVDKLADGGLASSLGASSADASNLIIGNGSTLRYTGTGDTTNRLFTLSAGTTFIESSGTGAIVFTDTGPVTLAGNNQARTVALGGTNAGDNTLAGSVSDAGTGKTILAKNDAGTWVLTGNNTYTGNTVVNDGILKIGAGGTTGSITSDVIVTGMGALGFNRADSYTYGGVISGTGIVGQIGSGTTILTGNNSYTGYTTVNAGTLLVNGDQSAATGTTGVSSGATLGGTGTIGGTVAVADGILSPGSNGAGTLTINGDLIFSSGSILSMQFGQAGTAGGALNDLITVKGDLTLDGTLDVAETAGGSFGPGIYRIIDYTGTLIDSGLNVGMLPSGSGAIQTSISGQVNLLAGGDNFSFWDGDAGPKFNGAIDGGNGVWQNSTGNNNWTEATGNINAAYSDGTFAIFAGTGGTVTIDNNLGQVTAEGMQFAANGYVINDGALELVGPQSTIRVGDGTTVGAAYTATINSVLTGNTQLEKTDAGTLVLTGANTYTGGTAINGGTLRISSDANLGAAAGGLSFNGGTLNTTTTMTSNRAVTLAGAGTFLTDPTVDLTLSGGIFGAGSLTKAGSGKLILTGDDSHTGGTTIASGTLQIGNGGTTGSIIGDIANNGALIFNRSDAPAYAGSVSGTGTLTKNGSGALTMTGNSTYTGVTAVNAGQLVLEGGGQISGTSSLTVSNGGQMIVDGAGSALKTGAGLSQIASTGSGTLTVRNGGTASFADFNSANGLGTTGTINVIGAGSVVTQSGQASFGRGGTATVNILDGGRMESSGVTLVGGQFPTQSTGIVTVSGAGSAWDLAGDLGLRRGSLTISDGGVVTAASSVVGYYAGTGPGTPTADLLVTGAGSRFDVAGALSITNTNSPVSRGSITIADGGVIKAGSLAMGPGNAALNIGGVEGGAAAHAGTLDAAAVTMTASSNRINFNHDSAGYIFGAAISGAGYVHHTGSGETVLTGNNSYAGFTTVSSGSLYINGDQTGATALTDVHAGATLGGSGTIGGIAIVNGQLNPGGLGNAPGTLTINGNLLLGTGSTQNFSFGQANVPGGPLNDLVNVGGDLTLAGTFNVDVSAGGAMDPGVYRVFNYVGALNNGGWTVNLPSPDFYVQTSIDHQVNLVNTAGMALRFWDGDAGGKNDGIIDGGDGIWQAFGTAPDYGYDNWTEDGSINAPFQDAAFAVFAGASGTVTVDDSKGAINVSGMQFITDGYLVTGDAITLVGASGSVIRVGDGTTGGKDTVATIDAEIAGSSQLVKSDMGTLILTGANSYTGGTKLTGGTLQVAEDTALGDLAGGLVFDGGTLNTTADMITDRTVAVTSAGTLRTNAGATLTLNGTISGAGTFTKDGAGRLELTSDNSAYTGAASIVGGTLTVGNVLGGSMNVGIDGRLEGAGTVGATTNAGVISAGLDGVGTLTVNGNYTGNDGRLEIATVLGNDASVTSRLAVTGDTAGTTTVGVTNRGGLGAQTVEGIKIIDVGGASNGTFSLAGDYLFNGEQSVVAGAYGYRLYKGSVSAPADGDWYLRSSLLDPKDPTDPTDPDKPLYQPGVPIYESYAGSLQQLNKLGTLQQRVGNRAWAPRADSAKQDRLEQNTVGNNGVWARIEAAHAKFTPEMSTSAADYDARTWKLQSGVDGVLLENGVGSFIGGVFAQYGTVSSDVWSPYGAGSVDTTGAGVGATLTWYGDSGLYVDAQAQLVWYDSDLHSATAGKQLVSGNNGVGYGLSLEAGQRIAVSGNWSLTPQAQLAYSSVSVDDFTDVFGARISLDRSESLIGRFGVAVNHDVEWLDENGRLSRAHLYGIANLSYDFLGKSETDVAGIGFASRDDRLYGGVGLGGSFNWANDKYTLYGEARLNGSLEDIDDSNAVGGTVGFRMQW